MSVSFPGREDGEDPGSVNVSGPNAKSDQIILK